MSDAEKLYTFEISSGGQAATFGGLSEAHARSRAALYHPHVGPAYADTKRCVCVSKAALSVRQAGWLICARRECSGYIG